eukprot:CAMPEP_0117567004 /NCGR_PEP_ID=MMETSP0784-20121206/57380_1 /TAXON_ID=39447 /ORGANISM="" /LENGTH=105 /DNA_ID=CAMNT_0005364855 /DNA_START=177 /DNA_END=495 /DNA_ORIENTATION=-
MIHVVTLTDPVDVILRKFSSAVDVKAVERLPDGLGLCDIFAPTFASAASSFGEWYFHVGEIFALAFAPSSTSLLAESALSFALAASSSSPQPGKINRANIDWNSS